MVSIAALTDRYKTLFAYLNEKQRRLIVALDSELLGWGSIGKISKASGVSRSTILAGSKELTNQTLPPEDRIRKKGGGRKPLQETDTSLESDLESLISPSTRGEPDSPLRWCSKSLRKISDALKEKGHKISHNAVGMLLRSNGYSLQENRKVHEGSDHPDRDKQFQYINERVKKHLKQEVPVISIDCKKKELIGNYKNGGREWEPAKTPVEVEVYDFPNKDLGKASPYGIYDIALNQGWVNIGISHDTAEFAVQSIRTWWNQMGKSCYEHAKELMITADGGGSNSSRSRLWKFELQKFSNETGLEIHVSHFPPGTSKWNKIEHRLFSFITMNWRAKPLTSLQVIVELIGNTTSSTGLKVRTSIDRTCYEKGIKISDEELGKINIDKHDFHGEWNYSIKPIV